MADMRRSAEISEDGLYRYRLIRRWDDRRHLLPFVMLNPSIADAEHDDPTIRRCIGFAQRLDFGGIGVWNLYAYRATDPFDLWQAQREGVDIVGPDNDRRLRNILAFCHLQGVDVVAAWGANAPAERVAQVLALPYADLTLHALGVTKDGAPKHPLARGLHRIPDDARPVRWTGTQAVTS